MSNVIKPKRSNTASKVPTTSDLTSGELGVNMADQKVYINNGTSVVQVGAGNLSGLGDTTISSPSTNQVLQYNGSKWINATAGGTGTVTSVSGTGTVNGLTLSGTVTTLGNITLGGTLSGIANTALTNSSITINGTATSLGGSISVGTITSITAGTGLSGGTITGSGTIALANTAVTAGSYTTANITVDAQGRITSASNGAGGVTSFSAGTTGLTPSSATTGAITLAGTLAIANGGTGATSASAALTSLGAYPSSNPSGYTNNTGTVTSVSGTGTVSGLTLSGTVSTTGSLTLGGTLSLTSGNVTTALGYTPYNSTNPSGYITSAGTSAACSGNAATATTATNQSGGTVSCTSAYNTGWYSFPDGTRDANNGVWYPNVSPRSVRWFFANAGSTGTGGNYSGVMQFDPWDGTTASTGDASYQLAFGSTAANGGGIPQLNIRKGIDTTWNSWYTLLHSGNYNSYSPTLTGGGASGTWGINVTGSANSASYATYLSGAPAYTNGGDGWWRSNGNAGLYFASYGRGVWPADASISYGNATVYGGGLNGWQGWGVNTSNNCVLMSNGSTHGFYNPANGIWQAQWDYAGNVTWGGSVTASSDIRLKQNIREIDNVTERRNTLAKSAIKYEKDGKTTIGYGAQYLREGGCDEFVEEAQDDAYKLATGVGTLSVEYGKTTAILAVASKMTDDKVEQLEARINQLEKIINGLLK